jgi:site-specific recombinase XerD
MMDSVFLVEGVREKHLNAPLLAERESYLAYLFEIGTRRERVRNVATMLLHIVRLLELNSPRLVSIDEILQGSMRWVNDTGANRHRKVAEASANTFKLVATNWLRYQGSLIVVQKPKPGFHNLLSQFLNDMDTQRGLALETIRSYRSRVLAFLNWLQPRCSNFSSVRPLDIGEFLDAKRADGWTHSSVAAHCHALRTFFGYAERQGWCSSGLQRSICSPRVPRIAAMFLLFAIYGFRSAEVRALTLEDIDWKRESITVRRAKRGMIQQFPLQGEVGDAIVLYLQKMRPRCSCRNVFVTLHPPYRPVSGHSMSAIIGLRMKKLGVANEEFGPHMLRHACATQLLRTGSSLKDIADFLGHRDLRSVSNYVKYDLHSLKKVAEFSLRGVL